MVIKEEKFCCLAMECLIENPDCPLKYRPSIREYLLTIPSSYWKKKNTVYMVFPIEFCPRCGKKLPKSLEDEWTNLVAKKFQITDPLFTKKAFDQLPKEFQTDEWWKKRGL